MTPIWTWFVYFLSLGWNIACCVNFYRRENQLNREALEKRPLISDEMNAILRDGDSLVVRLGKDVDIDFIRQVSNRAKVLSARGIKLYPIIDVADKPYMLLVEKQPLLEEPAPVEKTGSGDRNAP